MALETPCPQLPCPLPSRREVHRFLEGLLESIFPEFFHLPENTYARYLLSLTPSLTASLEYGGRCRETAANRWDELRRELEDFGPSLRELLESDVQAAYEGDPAARDAVEIVLSYPAIETLAVQRFAHFLYRRDVPLLPRMMTEWSHSRTGIDIHPGASIGPRFFIDHGTGVVIGETCVIGSGVKLYQGVTLGAISFPRDDKGKLLRDVRRHPIIGDDVVIYANATILGGKTKIGARSTIGASVFLMESVPENSLVALRDNSARLERRSKQRPNGEQGSLDSSAL